MKVHCETPFWSYAKEPHLLVEPHQTLGNGEKTHGSQRKNGGKNLQLMNLCVCILLSMFSPGRIMSCSSKGSFLLHLSGKKGQLRTACSGS